MAQLEIDDWVKTSRKVEGIDYVIEGPVIDVTQDFAQIEVRIVDGCPIPELYDWWVFRR